MASRSCHGAPTRTAPPAPTMSTYVDWDTVDAGRQWGQWMADALGGEGNVVFLGGLPRQRRRDAAARGHQRGLRGQPRHHAADRVRDYARHELGSGGGPAEHDGAARPASATSTASSRTTAPMPWASSAHSRRPAVSWCRWPASRPTSWPATSRRSRRPTRKYELATISSRNWLGRVAARKAIAAAKGITNERADALPLPIFEDTLDGLALQCDARWPPTSTSPTS